MMRQSGWMRWAFLGSLALNLLLIGLAVGAALRGPSHAPRALDLGLGEIGQALDREDRRAIGQALRQQLGERGAPGRAMLRAERAEIAAAIRAEPFDPAALEALIVARRERGDAMMAAGEQALLARIAALDPAARAALAARFVEAAPPPRRRGN